MKVFLKEPLLHFLLIGVVLFVIYEVLNPSSNTDEKEVIINSAQIASLSAKFERTWKRPPEIYELTTLINEHVLDEVYFRQAIALGIEKNDPLIRRRLRQKMEFYTSAGDVNAVPPDNELHAFYQNNIQAYKTENRYTLKQIFINTDIPVNKLNKRLSQIKKSLNTAGTVKGDASFIPEVFNSADRNEITRFLGERFYKQLAELPVKQWTGPVKSGLGLHYVYIVSQIPGSLPPLKNVKSRVIKDWRYQKNLNLREMINKRLLADYVVNIEWPVEGL